jgi:putative phosphoserine phosphatase/1-acylglycerol-3-phosphate O-acyltransferase
MPRGTNVFRPTAVEIKVFPPVPTNGWKKKDLAKNIEKVRGLFLKELGQEH